MRIRRADERDAAGINRIYNRAIRETVATFDLEEWSLERRCAWLSERGGPLYGAWVLEDPAATGTQAVQGFACNGPFREKAAYRCSTETSVYLDPLAQGQGWGRRLYVQLLSRLAPELHRAYAGVTLPNPASEALHAGLGFRVVGVLEETGWKFGAYHSVRWYELVLPVAGG